jgi:predicted AlkP superfamily phosphohydrolase/phosphomutase
MQLGFGHPEGIEERLLRSVRYKAATAQWLLQRAAWDLAVVGFGETHCAGHYLWPSGVHAVDGGPDSAFERLFAVYAEVDRAVGALAASLPSDATLIVVSGDGVRANHCGWHLLPAILNRLGYTSTGQTSGTSEPARPSLLRRLPQLVPPGVKERIAAGLPMRVRNRLGLWAQAAGLKWSETRAFALPTDLEGCIRINLRGREPEGIVEPGAQYHDLCQEIRARLEELVNPATGAPAVHRVWIRDEIFPGPRQEELPDVIVTWNDAAPIAALTSPRAGLVEGANPDRRPGTHSTSGFLMAQGPGIPREHQGRGRLVDVAPTVLHLLGVPQTDDLEGTAWRAVAGEFE